MDKSNLPNRQTQDTENTSTPPETYKTHIRIGQLNAHHSKVVMDELREEIVRKRIDIVAIQEPYSLGNSIPGLGTTTKIITDRKSFTLTPSVDCTQAAIAVSNTDLTVLKVEQLSNTHCVCVVVTRGHISVFIVSVYFQWCDDVEPYIQHLDMVLQHLKGKNVIVCADTNAKSELWHSNCTDERGEKLELLVAQHNLYVINKPSSTHTFSNIHGSSNIDVTFANPTCFNRIHNWKIHTNSTSSDHNLITIDVKTGNNNSASTTPATRYNTKRANWDRFGELLRNKLNNSEMLRRGDDMDPDALVTELEHIITKTSDETIPKKTRFQKSAPWWTKELTALKKQVRKARRNFQNSQNSYRQEEFRSHFQLLRNQYTRKIRIAKSTSWREFVTAEGNSNPWGIVYKIKMDKIQTDTAFETIKTGTTQTTTTEQTLETLLNALIPDDDPSGETAWQEAVREDAKRPPDSENTPPFSFCEVETAVKKLKNGKAPGHDLIEAAIIKAAWPVINLALTKILNCCLSAGTFPKSWKQGMIRVLLKDKSKEKTDPKSYRPICLLPILSKVLEKLISQRLEPLFSAHPLASSRQFGFKKGRSTEDAIVELRQTVNQISQKYVIAMLFDISGAFDNVWWPSILQNLKKRDCPRNIYNLIQSYLTDRSATIYCNNNLEISKLVNRGCPQGSILGPCFWNLVFDDLLNTLEASGYRSIAYADDLVVTISGNCRKSIEQQANLVVETISKWCRNHKLQLSQSKSEMILLKGFLDIKRPPTVKIGQSSMRMASAVRYLGVHFGLRFNITPHIKHITRKSKTTFNRLSHIARAHWGISYRNMMTLYKGIFVPVITYAAAGWGDKLNAWHTKTIAHAQRYALLRVTRAYRTISHEALTVLAAATPIELVIEEKRALYQLKRNRQFTLGSLTFNPQEEAPDRTQTNELRNQIKSETANIWQNNWEHSTKGRVTYKFFTDIKDRLDKEWLKLSFYNMQLLSGHGLLKNYQYKLKVSPTEQCYCNSLDSIEHLIFDCTITTAIRLKLARKLDAAGTPWPCELKYLVREETFGAFTEFATEALKHRQQLEYSIARPAASQHTPHTTVTNTERRTTRASTRQQQTQQ